MIILESTITHTIVSGWLSLKELVKKERKMEALWARSPYSLHGASTLDLLQERRRGVGVGDGLEGHGCGRKELEE